MTKPLIKWEKHSDPWGDDLADREWPGAIDDKKHDYDDFSQLLDDDDEDEHRNGKGKGKILITPAGIIPITDETNPSKVFDLWMMHTNFDISEEILDAIDEVAGVELTYVFSRYRMMVGFAKLFKSQDVKIDIEMAVGVIDQLPLSRENPQLWDQVSKLKLKLSAQPFWAIHVLPNSKVAAISGDKSSESVFREQFNVLQEAHEKVGGYFLRYSDAET